MNKMKKIMLVFFVLATVGCARHFTYSIEYKVVKNDGEELVLHWEGNYEPKVKLIDGCLYVDKKRYECEVDNFYYVSRDKKRR